jgi:hypothetical protein
MFASGVSSAAQSWQRSITGSLSQMETGLKRFMFALPHSYFTVLQSLALRTPAWPATVWLSLAGLDAGAFDPGNAA